MSKINTVNSTVFGYNKSGKSIQIGTTFSGNFYARVSDGLVSLKANTGIVNTGDNHIGVLKKNNKIIDLQYYDSANSISTTNDNTLFEQNTTFNQSLFSVGSYEGTEFLDGNVSELIVYNRALSDTEIADVRGYLNLKYKIY